MQTSADHHDYAELRGRLLVAVRRLAPSSMADQVEDLVQTGILRILATYASDDVPNALLYRIAHSVVVDEIRRSRRRNEIGLTPSMPERLEARQPTPEGTARGTQLGDVVVDCLGELSPDRRRVVTLYLQGHGVPDIAGLLGLERKQTENLVYRGMKDLRGALSERGFAP
ncbi:MAG: RNA polymerase sigma factor [Myxococcales bacterium]|nr:RNA polymerase sigma factor [Myxococcales bacterium]